jgi:AcrR family transcriptional regulator
MCPAKTKPLRWERRPDDRPQELLEASLRVFATQGYRNTRIEEVAAEAGVTKGAVYHYFANKEELLLRALEQYQERAFGRMEDALRKEHGPASARVRLMLRRAFGSDDPVRRDVLLLLQGVAAEVPDVYRRWLASGPMHASRLLASLIDAGKKTGEFRADVDSKVAARLVLAGLVTQFVWQCYADEVPGLAIDQDRFIDSSVDLLLAGLRPVAASPGGA